MTDEEHANLRIVMIKTMNKIMEVFVNMISELEHLDEVEVVE